METEKKQKLLPYFAFLYSKQVNPEKYESVDNMEEWSSLIESDEETLSKINQVVEELTDEDWNIIESRYNDEFKKADTKNTVAQFAKNGAKLDTLKKLSSYKSEGKKCKCGCELVVTKEEGGKLVSKCACGCESKKLPKKKVGGIIDEEKFDESFKKFSNKWERRSKSNKIKKFKE